MNPKPNPESQNIKADMLIDNPCGWKDKVGIAKVDIPPIGGIFKGGLSQC